MSSYFYMNLRVWNGVILTSSPGYYIAWSFSRESAVSVHPSHRANIPASRMHFNSWFPTTSNLTLCSLSDWQQFRMRHIYFLRARNWFPRDQNIITSLSTASRCWNQSWGTGKTKTKTKTNYWWKGPLFSQLTSSSLFWIHLDLWFGLSAFRRQVTYSLRQFITVIFPFTVWKEINKEKTGRSLKKSQNFCCIIYRLW